MPRCGLLGGCSHLRVRDRLAGRLPDPPPYPSRGDGGPRHRVRAAVFAARTRVAGQVRVWITPYDRDHCRWRIEVLPDGRVWVWRMSDSWVASAPQRYPRDIGELGVWMVERGIDPEDLVPG